MKKIYKIHYNRLDSYKEPKEDTSSSSYSNEKNLHFSLSFSFKKDLQRQSFHNILLLQLKAPPSGYSLNLSFVEIASCSPQTHLTSSQIRWHMDLATKWG